MNDTVYEFLLNSLIGFGSLHDNELRWRVANENCYKVTKIDLAFTNKVHPLFFEIYDPKSINTLMKSIMIPEDVMTASYIFKTMFDFS